MILRNQHPSRRNSGKLLISPAYSVESIQNPVKEIKNHYPKNPKSSQGNQESVSHASTQNPVKKIKTQYPKEPSTHTRKSKLSIQRNKVPRQENQESVSKGSRIQSRKSLISVQKNQKSSQGNQESVSKGTQNTDKEIKNKYVKEPRIQPRKSRSRYPKEPRIHADKEIKNQYVKEPRIQS